MTTSEKPLSFRDSAMWIPLKLIVLLQTQNDLKILKSLSCKVTCGSSADNTNMIISLGSRGERELRIFAKVVNNAFTFFCCFFTSLVSISNKENSEHTSSNCGYGFVVLTKLSKWLKYILIKGVHTRGCSLPHAMIESTKSGQEGQRKYNTNGKRVNRRGVMVLGMLKRGGHVPTDVPASNLLVAQCH